MLKTLAISNYRSILDLVIPLGQLNVITGANGSGKSNLYNALRLLAETARGGVVGALAREGGLPSTLWAGPESLSKGMLQGHVPIQGTVRKKTNRMRLGFATDEVGYSLSLGFPGDDGSGSLFQLDPEIKQETIWYGDYYRATAATVVRKGPMVKAREKRRWQVIAQSISGYESMFSEIANPGNGREIFDLRQTIRNWRFYDHFRTDRNAQTRVSHIGTRTPVLDHDGHSLAAALQTIYEIGDGNALNTTIEDAFPGAKLQILVDEQQRFSVLLHQHGLLRPLTTAELSDGTLRYLLLAAALLTPRPPALMVLNEPENSLHPDLLPALGRLIVHASQHSQVWVISHASRLIAALLDHPEAHHIELEKDTGQTVLKGQELLTTPLWHWPDSSR